MSAYLKIIAFGAVVVGLLAGFLIYRAYTSNDFEKRLSESDPIGIRVALVDETRENALEIVGQAILYPEHDRVLFYFLNTDAYFEGDKKTVSTESPRSADRFADYTGVDSDYTVTVSRKDLVRLVNLAGGLDMFLEDVFLIENSQFQYPRGVQFWPGEQVAEYALGRTKMEPDRVQFSGVERLLRIESVLLNFFWKKKAYLEKLSGPEIWRAAVALVDTNLSPSEARSVVDYLVRDDIHCSVLEVPLEVSTESGGPGLVVKEQRAKLLYNNFRDNMVAGRLNSDQFPIEVLNGTETAQLANRVQQYMKDRGGQVLDAANYPYKPVYNTVVLERAGNSYYAHKLLDMTGMTPDRVYFRRQTTDVSISLVLGDDFDIKKFFK